MNSSHETVLSFENKHRDPLPPEFQGGDVRLAEEFIEFILKQYTREGDIVLDPFAGFGTTLMVAERLNRKCYGIEVDKARYDYAATRLRNREFLIHGNSLELAKYRLPALDLVLFSPPYMLKDYHSNPLRGEMRQVNCYPKYLEDLLAVARSAKGFLKDGKHLVVEVSNLEGIAGITTLAWDIARLFMSEFVFIKEKIIHWGGGYGYGYDHSYCLIFQKGGRPTSAGDAATHAAPEK